MILSIPDLNRGDTSAMKEITTIQTAQVEYYETYGRFAASMQELGPPVSGAEGPSAAGLIERDPASGEKNGDKFTLTSTTTGYTISVLSGNRTSYVHIDSEPADPALDPPEIRSPGTPTPQSPVPASSERYSYPAPARRRTQSQS
jgi:hypothetical protein